MDIKNDINQLATEQQNQKTTHLDEMSVLQICECMNEEDSFCVKQVRASLDSIEPLIQACIKSIQANGRIFYIGAGTSGRLGLLDAVECAPTFSCSDEIQGIMAGGTSAFVKAKEGVEDDEHEGAFDIAKHNISKNDIVIGIAASGRTPYVIGALKKARECGALCGSIACNSPAQISSYADYPIEINTGSEVLSGSTRLKAGTAQKLVLNMISTATMIKIGKVYGNLMVDMKSSNEKLVERAIHMVMNITNLTYPEAKDILKQANYHVKEAVLMALLEISIEDSKSLLVQHHGFLRHALQGKSI